MRPRVSLFGAWPFILAFFVVSCGCCVSEVFFPTRPYMVQETRIGPTIVDLTITTDSDAAMVGDPNITFWPERYRDQSVATRAAIEAADAWLQREPKATVTINGRPLAEARHAMSAAP